MLRKIIYKIKCYLSYAYRIKRGWGLSATRNDRELKAVYEFCKMELKNSENIDAEENSIRKNIYEMTVLLYEQGQSNDPKVFTKLHKFKIPQQGSYNNVEDFINSCVGWYWN